MGKPLGEVRREDPGEPLEGPLHLIPATHQIPLFNEELHAFCHRHIEVEQTAGIHIPHEQEEIVRVPRIVAACTSSTVSVAETVSRPD